MYKKLLLISVCVFALFCGCSDDEAVDNSPVDNPLSGLSYAIVDTGQSSCYDASNAMSVAPSSGAAYYGQDAQYTGNQPSFRNNGDGTITDLQTGLMWQQDPGEKLGYTAAVTKLGSFKLGNHTDWRLPTIKELYSLINFNGQDISGVTGTDASSYTPFIDTAYFTFSYGAGTTEERLIDSQYLSATFYVSTTMNGDETIFGVNFADGRIKGYPRSMGGEEKTFYVIFVRGNTNYGKNSFTDNSDGTISDSATGLMWMQQDSGYFKAGADNDGKLSWEEALQWAETNSYAGYSDWRLPNAKELQSIIDYTRSPDTTGSAAIDPLFQATKFTNEGGVEDYGYYWSSTSHINHTGQAPNGVYLSFGRALGYMAPSWLDVHGAGAQRSDPKTGDPADYPTGHGPQGDAIRIYNYARLVRNVN